LMVRRDLERVQKESADKEVPLPARACWVELGSWRLLLGAVPVHVAIVFPAPRVP
jgi:hypothetical protein